MENAVSSQFWHCREAQQVGFTKYTLNHSSVLFKYSLIDFLTVRQCTLFLCSAPAKLHSHCIGTTYSSGLLTLTQLQAPGDTTFKHRHFPRSQKCNSEVAIMYPSMCTRRCFFAHLGGLGPKAPTNLGSVYLGMFCAVTFDPGTLQHFRKIRVILLWKDESKY